MNIFIKVATNSILSATKTFGFLKTNAVGFFAVVLIAMLVIITPYKAIAQANTPIAEYRFDELSYNGITGELIDTSSNAFNGQSAGGTLSEDAQMCKGATFDGTNDHFSLPPIATDFSGGFSAMAWVEFADVGQWEPIFDIGNGSADDNIYFSRRDSSDDLSIIIYNGTTECGDVSASNAIQAGRHHYAVTVSGAQTAVIYRDGVAVHTETINCMPLNVSRSVNYIGRSSWSNDDYFDSEIDELKLYDTGLSATNIADIYNNESAGTNYDGSVRSCPALPSPLAEYRLEALTWAGAEHEVVDYSGNDYHGKSKNNTQPKTSSPALLEDSNGFGTCGYASQTSGAVQVKLLPLDVTTVGVKTTIAFWMNWDGSEYVMPIGWHLHDLYFSDGHFGFNTANSDIYGISSSGLANEWHHVVAEFTNGSVTTNRIYIDGVEKVLTQRMASPDNTTAFVKSEMRIGGWTNDGGYRFEGLLDEVKIYEKALSTIEVHAIMNERHDCQTPHVLVAEYRFDEFSYDGTSGELIDSSSNAFNGQSAGGTLSQDAQMCSGATFDGVDDHFSIPPIATDLSSGFSAMAWVDFGSIGQWEPIFDIGNGSANNNVYFSRRDSSNDLSMIIYNGTTECGNVIASNAIQAGRHHYAVTVSETQTAVIYRDGVAVHTDYINCMPQNITRSVNYVGRSSWSNDDYFDSEIDELKIFASGLSAANVADIYAQESTGNNYDGSARTCPAPPIPPVHHYEIVHDGQGLTCDAEVVTVKACLDAGCTTLSSEIVTLEFLSNGVLKDSPSFIGSAAVSVSNTNAETVSFSLANTSMIALNPVACSDGTGNSCDMIFTNAGFRFLYGGTTNVDNQIAGTAFGDTLQLQAVENSNGVCTALFNGNVSVNLSQENVDPGGSSGLSFTSNSVAVAKHPNVSATTLHFDANGIASIPTPIYQDAGQIRLHANYNENGIALLGSSNSFWVRPAELVLIAQNGASDIDGATAVSATTHPAGENFSFSISAYNGASPKAITPNYVPGQVQLKVTRTGPTLAGSVDGSFRYGLLKTISSAANANFEDITLPTFIAGLYSYNDAHYSEVGLLNLDIQDSNYGDDAMVVPAADINIGRFVPQYFTQTVALAGSLQATCGINMSFGAYSGQKDETDNNVGAISYFTNPVLAITAYNKQGSVTQNYFEDIQGGNNDFMKLSVTDVIVNAPSTDLVAKGVDNTLLPLTASISAGTLSQNDLSVLPSIVALPKGTVHYALSNNDHFFYARSLNAKVPPFDSEITFSIGAITDADGVSATTTASASPDGIEIRFGRLLLENSFGSENTNLAQHLKLEHYTDSGFVTTVNNDCVSYDASNMSLSNISLDPNLSGINTITGHFFAGETTDIELNSPGTGNQGRMGVTYDAYEWLKYDWNNNGNIDENPFATATFGIYRGDDRYFNWREVIE